MMWKNFRSPYLSTQSDKDDNNVDSHLMYAYYQLSAVSYMSITCFPCNPIKYRYYSYSHFSQGQKLFFEFFSKIV